MPTILLSKIYPKGSALKNLRVGSTDVKYVKRGDGKLLYDTLKSTTYNKPSITLTYPTSNTPAAGGTTSPSSFSYSQSWYYTGHSGNTYSQTNKTSGATVEYSISGTGASINASTGVVTWTSRGTTHSTSTRSATVTVKVTLNGQSNTATATVTQQANNIVSTDTYYTVSIDSNPNPNYGPIPQAGAEMALNATAYKQTVTTYASGSVSYGDETYLTVTVKVYINNVLQTTYTVPHNAGSPLWQCPANTSNQSRTIKFVASISESTQTATFENIQLGSSDNYVFQTGGLNMIGYSTAASGFTADVGINSTKNGTPQSFAVTSATSWLSGTISQLSGFSYGTHLFTIKASANTGSARSGTITITQTGSGMTLTYTLTQQGV